MAESNAIVILVHGGFHGAWCWQKVINHLTESGIQAIAMDLPGRGAGPHPEGGLADCAASLRSCIGAGDKPVIVCGHSLGGAVITEGVDRNSTVRHVVFLAALVPDIAENAIDNAPELLAGEVGKASLRIEDGTVIVDPAKAGDIFYHECDPETTEWAISQLCSQNPGVTMTPVTQAAWHYCESTYVICDNDHALPVIAQERLAARCGHVVRFPTGHSPMLSHPRLVGDLLYRLAVSTDSSN